MQYVYTNLKNWIAFAVLHLRNLIAARNHREGIHFCETRVLNFFSLEVEHFPLNIEINGCFQISTVLSDLIEVIVAISKVFQMAAISEFKTGTHSRNKVPHNECVQLCRIIVMKRSRVGCNEWGDG